MMAAVPAASCGHEEVVSTITEQVTCAVCFEVFCQPRTLPCCHVFCLKCLEEILSKTRGAGDTLDCPMCRKPAEVPASGARGFQAAFQVTKLIEFRTKLLEAPPPLPPHVGPTCHECPKKLAIGLCQECNQFVCQQCEAIHTTLKIFSSHIILPLGSRPRAASEVDQVCPSHPLQLMTSYCEDCDKMVCPRCLDGGEHRGHTHRHLVDVIHQAKDTINTQLLSPVMERLSKVSVAIRAVENRKSHVSQQSAELKHRIESEINKTIALLEEKKGNLKKEVDDITEKKMKVLLEQKEKLDVVSSRLSGHQKAVEMCLKNGSRSQILAVRNTVQRKASRDDEKEDDGAQVSLSPLEDANLYFFLNPKSREACGSVGQVLTSTICPVKSSVEGEGLHKASVGEVSSLTLTLLTSDGVPSKEQLKQVAVELVPSSGEPDHTAVLGRLVGQAGNEAELCYTPSYSGDYELSISIAGEQVRGSPCRVQILPMLRFRGNFVRAISGLKYPWGLAVTQSGNLVVIDSWAVESIHIFSPSGSKLTSFSKGGHRLLTTPEGSCYEPSGVAVDLNDNILVVDGGNHRIQVFSQSGEHLSTVGEKGGKMPLQFNDPVGIGVNSEGEVHVCDRGNHRIQVLRASASDSNKLVFVHEYGRFGNESDCFHHPRGVAFDSRGNTYIADCSNYCVKVFGPDGAPRGEIGREGNGQGQFRKLSSICIDRNDFIYTMDRQRKCVSVFDPSWELRLEFGTGGSKEGQFCDPKGIAVDSCGRVYVSDYYSGNVQVFE